MLDMFSIAVFLFSLALRAYLVTYLRLACPNMAAMSTGLIFLRTRSVAKEWRAQCHVIFLVMPALLHQRLRALQQALYVGSLKI